jgi:SAM-dependent methyltransferase
MLTLLGGVARLNSDRSEWTPPDTLMLRDVRGDVLPLDPSRWHGPTTDAEQQLLAMVKGPVLDIGCGPGRIVQRLAIRGVVALGVDPAPGAVSLARRRGCAVLQRSVFETLPGEGRWQTVLLIDGNIGIGGDPVRLLRRCHALIHVTGSVVAEVEAPGCGWRTCRARLERGRESSPWFEWSVVGADAITGLAAGAGLRVCAIDQASDHRWFAHLTPRTPRSSRAHGVP